MQRLLVAIPGTLILTLGVVLAVATLLISPLGYLLTPWLGRLADNAAAALFFVA